MNNEGFMINGWELITNGKTSGWVLSDKKLVHGLHHEDHFEKRTIIIAKSEVRQLYDKMVSESIDEEEDC